MGCKMIYLLFLHNSHKYGVWYVASQRLAVYISHTTTASVVALCVFSIRTEFRSSSCSIKQLCITPTASRLCGKSYPEALADVYFQLKYLL